MNRLLCCVVLTLVAPLSLAKQAAWYQVEMMMFAYTDPEQLSEEQWPVPENPPAASIAAPKSSYGLDGLGYFYKAANLMNQAVISARLPVTPPLYLLNPTGAIRQNSMNWHAKRLSKQRDIQVVWHETWVEAVQSKPGAAIHPVNLMLPGEPEIHVTGGFNLHVGRYLHLKTDLTIQHIGMMPVEVSTDKPLALPASTAPSSATPMTALQQRGTLRYAHFKQSRRMRSKELHYVDHPLLGVLIKLTPIRLPAAK